MDVVYLSVTDGVPPHSYWDQTLIDDLLKDFDYHESVDGLEGAVLVIPARNQADNVEKINQELDKLKWCVVMLTGDEEGKFPVEKLKHPQMRIWVMSPKQGRHDAYGRLGCGYAPLIKEARYQEKVRDWFFSGQVNNDRRVKLVSYLQGIPNGLCNQTEGFSQGLPQNEYYNGMAGSKICLCPPGNHTPDTFRFFEALELGCIPIVDEQPGTYEIAPGYWTWFFEELTPFPILSYEGLKDYISEWSEDWKQKSNNIYAWWQQYKRKIRCKLEDQIRELSGIDLKGKITVLIPTSVISTHPDTGIIEQCIKDIRSKLPDSEIIIMFDGLNHHFEDRKAAYEEYIHKVLWKCNFEWKNCLPLLFNKPTHQVGMTRKALEYVRTPTILYVEHDTSICPDIEFGYSWDELVETILEGEANVVRFHHEASILEGSKGLLMGEVEKVNGVPMIRTMEWSQRPHLARTQFYKEMLATKFSPNAFGMIEDHIFGQVQTDCREHGMMGWYNWRLWIFHPEGNNIKRSYTLDGRKEDPKYDEDFKY